MARDTQNKMIMNAFDKMTRTQTACNVASKTEHTVPQTKSRGIRFVRLEKIPNLSLTLYLDNSIETTAIIAMTMQQTETNLKDTYISIKQKNSGFLASKKRNCQRFWPSFHQKFLS